MIPDSELRQDLVSGDWIVNAPGRVKRPRELLLRLPRRTRIPITRCPFENPQSNGNAASLLAYPRQTAWRVQVIENKYPAVSHGTVCARKGRQGPFAVVEGRGHHEILITRDHDRTFPRLSPAEASLTFQAFRDRYRFLARDACLAYVAIFHNWGPVAGASVYHPHYQIIAIPVVPPDVRHSLDGSLRYFRRHKTCVHCTMLAWEKKEKKRVVYENAGAIAFAPFVSREPFEVRIFPKAHRPYFEETSPREMAYVADALRRSLGRMEARLNDPDYNFFIHTAPLQDKKNYHHYHWHIEVLPKISVSAGFELGTGIEITVVDPNEAARILKQ